jgi:hypothetical protein
MNKLENIIWEYYIHRICSFPTLPFFAALFAQCGRFCRIQHMRHRALAAGFWGSDAGKYGNQWSPPKAKNKCSKHAAKTCCCPTWSANA